MGFPACQPFHARNRNGAGGTDDPRKAAGGLGRGRRAGCCLILALGFGALIKTAEAAETLRIATWNVGLERAGPGLLLRDIDSGQDGQVTAVITVLSVLDADAVLLTGVDFDLGLKAISALQDRLSAAGTSYPHAFAFAPNTGVATGLDLDGDGRRGGPRDAQGWGRFAGAGGMAILSRLPIDRAAARDWSDFLWVDLPGALLPPDMSARSKAVQRLATTGFWDVPLILPDGGRLHLLAWHATPPVFDGPEDRNGRRNHDEAAFWLRLLDVALPMSPPAAPFVLLGDANLDPVDGDGRRDAMAALLADPRLQDPQPKRSASRQEPGQSGDPQLDTALFDPPLGGLRLDYVLPSQGLNVADAGVLWPDGKDPLAPVLAQASRHYPVWVDIEPAPVRTPLAALAP